MIFVFCEKLVKKILPKQENNNTSIDSMNKLYKNYVCWGCPFTSFL